MTDASAQEATEIELFWQKERFRIPMPPPTTTLAHLKSQIYSLTGIAPENQKLIMQGAILRDDLAPLSAFGFGASTASSAKDAQPSKSFWSSWGFGKRKTVKLVLLGSNEAGPSGGRPPPETPKKEPAGPEDEATVMKRIQAISQNVEKDWTPAIKRFEAFKSGQEEQEPRGDETSSNAKSGTATPASLPMNERTSAVLSESLLQQLLKLDSIHIGPGMDQARKERKDAVRLVQAALDRVDRAKESPSKGPSS